MSRFRALLGRVSTLSDKITGLTKTVRSRVTRYTITLIALFVAVFLVRFLAINTQVGPPSEDLGGDLVVLHTYTQADPVFPNFRLEAPPLYYLLVILPMNTLFPALLAQKIVDAFVPSIVIFPFYFLCKLLIQKRLASSAASLMFSFSEAFNQIMRWGGTLNMFSFVFALPSLYYLTRIIRRSTSKDALLAALFLSLTIGSHQLTALYTIIVFIVVGALTFIPRLGFKPPVRAYASTAGLAAIFSAPYIPTYLFLVTNSVNLFSSAPLSPESVIAQLIYINARLSISAYLLIATSVFGFVMLAQARDKTGISMIGASSVAAIILVNLLNPTIFERAAYFLPIPFFLLVAGSYRYLLGLMERHRSWVKLGAGLLICLILAGFMIGDFETLQIATASNQVLDSQIVQGLDWLSLHTARNNAIYSDYPALGAWIAGYSERTELTPKPVDYVITSPDLALIRVANIISAGNYVLDSRSVTIGDFFPSTIYNPAVFLNKASGPQGLLFFDDDYQVLTFNNTAGTNVQSLVSAPLKTVLNGSSSSNSTSFSFSYSWPFGQINRTISASPPNIIHLGYSVLMNNSTRTSFLCRMLAFAGEKFDYSRISQNTTLMQISLPNGQTVPISISYRQGPGQAADSFFNENDNTTKLPTLGILATSSSSIVSLDLWITLVNLSFNGPVSSYSAFSLMQAYSVSYIFLDLRGYAQTIRFTRMGNGLVCVFRNSEVAILRIDGDLRFGPFYHAG